MQRFLLKLMRTDGQNIPEKKKEKEIVWNRSFSPRHLYWCKPLLWYTAACFSFELGSEVITASTKVISVAYVDCVGAKSSSQSMSVYTELLRIHRLSINCFSVDCWMCPRGSRHDDNVFNVKSMPSNPWRTDAVSVGAWYRFHSANHGHTGLVPLWNTNYGITAKRL